LAALGKNPLAYFARAAATKKKLMTLLNKGQTNLIGTLTFIFVESKKTFLTFFSLFVLVAGFESASRELLLKGK
jgi:hypothetical protein